MVPSALRPRLSGLIFVGLLATAVGCAKDNSGNAGNTGGAAASGGRVDSGGTGGPSGSGGAAPGTGGSLGRGGSTAAATGGSFANGGGSATGGGPATGGTGTAGSVATGGLAGGPGPGTGGAPGGRGGAASGGNAGAGGPVDCATLALCDTFESTTVGAAPNSSLWTIIPTAAGGTATIDSMGAHASSRSVKIVSPDRLYLRNSTAIKTLGPVAHVRFHVRFASVLPQGHSAFIVTHPIAVDQYTQQPELRLGGQDAVFHWNTDSDAANIPDVDPTNGDPLSFKPVANTWYCVELIINTSNGHLNVSVDGMNQPGLTQDGTPTTHIDQSWLNGTTSTSRYSALADFNIGWQSYGAGAMTLWFDDIALSGSPIGCP